MPRFYLPPGAWGEAPSLTGDEARHLSQVLRLRPGDAVTVFDGCGKRAMAVLRHVARDRADLEIGDVSAASCAAVPVRLAQSVTKGKAMDFIVQKAVELGVAAIQPLLTARTVVQPGEGKADKWRRAALEACKQCGQDRLPEIPEPASLAAWLAAPSTQAGLKLIASLEGGSRPLREVLRSEIFDRSAGVTLLIGPEGDFSPRNRLRRGRRDFYRCPWASPSCGLKPPPCSGFRPCSLNSVEVFGPLRG